MNRSFLFVTALALSASAFAGANKGDETFPTKERGRESEMAGMPAFGGRKEAQSETPPAPGGH